MNDLQALRVEQPVLSSRTLSPCYLDKVCVIGLGYIGLSTAAVLAGRGHSVLGVDISRNVVETINHGAIHIYEPGLGELIRSVVAQGRLRASLLPSAADVFIICVPTPIRSDRSPDLSSVHNASCAIRPFVRRGNLVVLESTSPLRTTVNVVAKQGVPDGMRVGDDVSVAYCPERVLPGRILTEIIENDRVVGGVTPACSEKAAAFYRSFVKGDVVLTSSVTAELVKLSENAHRDVNIAFANELSNLAGLYNVDPFEVIELANRHPRVNILNPGPGVGGHCISIDPWFVVHAAPELTPLMRTAREINDRQPSLVAARVEALVRRHRLRTVGCLGLTYKAETDDLRESPALEVVRELRRRKVGHILVCDPYVAPHEFTDFPLYPLQEVIRRSDLLLLLTDHPQFRDVLDNVLREKVAFDTRGLWRRPNASKPVRSHVHDRTAQRIAS